MVGVISCVCSEETDKIEEKERAGAEIIMLTYLLTPFLAAIVAGALNSVAGGGSFIAFPSLLFVGVPPIQANATTTAALWPGSVAAAWALRRELLRQQRALVVTLGSVSLFGGVCGAILLLITPQETFVRLIPFLMLAATLLFASSPFMNAQVKRRSIKRQLARTEAGELSECTSAVRLPWTVLVRLAVMQLVIATYGGYFGGGIGILMLATLGLMGMEDIHEMNAVKNTLASCINGVAVVTFIVAGAVYWANALTMVVGSIVGGYAGAFYARKIDQRLVRAFVIVVGCVLTVYFLFKYGYM